MAWQTKVLTSCIVCEKSDFRPVISLTPTPPANAFSEVPGQPTERYPLDVQQCRCCGNVQLKEVVNPELLFRNYRYISSVSPSFLEHLRRYADFVMLVGALSRNSLVVEIGSNDGAFLEYFISHNVRVLGVDPAKNLAILAEKRNIPVLTEFFSEEIGRQISETYGPADVVVANNVFAHSAELVDMLRGVRALLKPDGLFIFEVQYLLDIVKDRLFDNFYCEHIVVWCIRALDEFLTRHDFKLIDVILFPTHGGSFRAVTQLRGGRRRRQESVDAQIRHETSFGLFSDRVFQEFREDIERRKDTLRVVLRDLLRGGARIVGFGAPAKATTLLYHYQLLDTLVFVVDDNPLKQGCYIPGSPIPILPVSEIYEQRPDYVLILAWNFQEAIRQKHEEYRRRIGRWIIPSPEVQIF